jgi:hypothetical protein
MVFAWHWLFELLRRVESSVQQLRSVLFGFLHGVESLFLSCTIWPKRKHLGSVRESQFVIKSPRKIPVKRRKTKTRNPHLSVNKTIIQWDSKKVERNFRWTLSCNYVKEIDDWLKIDYLWVGFEFTVTLLLAAPVTEKETKESNYACNSTIECKNN